MTRDPIQRTRILIADDDDEVLELVRVLLGRAGYQVLIATDGRTALRGLFTRRPDLMVLNLDIPVLDGWQVLESVRHLSDLPVIALSASDNEFQRARALRAGADDWIRSPCSGEELLERIEAALALVAHENDDDVDDGLTVVDLLQHRA
jgi:DNA-binding response OmpR family regulator